MKRIYYRFSEQENFPLTQKLLKGRNSTINETLFPDVENFLGKYPQMIDIVEFFEKKGFHLYGSSSVGVPEVNLSPSDNRFGIFRDNLTPPKETGIIPALKGEKSEITVYATFRLLEKNPRFYITFSQEDRFLEKSISDQFKNEITDIYTGDEEIPSLGEMKRIYSEFVERCNKAIQVRNAIISYFK